MSEAPSSSATPPEEGPPTTGGTPSLPPPPSTLEDQDFTPTPTPDGVAGPLKDVYKDKGAADESATIRGLIAFPIRNREALEAALQDMYEPSSPSFRRYMTPQEWMDRHAPSEEDVTLVAEWVRSRGMHVPPASCCNSPGR